jgi:hypothetical protein
MLMFVNIKDENSVTKKNIGNEKKKLWRLCLWSLWVYISLYV